MKKLLLLFSVITLWANNLPAAPGFTEKEKSVIYTNAIKVLENYNLTINQIGEDIVNNIDKAKSGAESLLELFVNRQVLIYNDLDPSHKLSEFYEAETYSHNIILWYPDGITINLDLANARVSEISAHDENVYSLDILVKKTINGNYMNQALNKSSADLTFRIAFTVENKSLGKFRIVGIRSASSNYVIDDSQALREVNSEDFTSEDLAKIRSEIKTVLGDYSNYLSLIGDPQEPAEDKVHYKESFTGLFRNTDARVYNDIMPDPQTSLLTVTEYLAGFVNDYPNGIRNLSVYPDSVKFGRIIKDQDGSFYTYADADKFFSGSYKGKEIFREMFPLIFKVSFTAAGKVFSDFRISSIDIAAVNFYEAAPGAVEAPKPQTIIKPVSRKGLGMSINASFGQTSINDGNIKTMTLEDNQHNWDVSPLYGFISAIGVHYYFNDNLSIKSGLEYNKYSGSFNLSGKFTSGVTSTDINSDTYYKVIEASYDSIVTINYITFPLVVSYTSGKPGRLGFYGEAGLKVSIPKNAHYRDTGYYKYYGYYPNHPVFTQIVNIKELGYYTREDINTKGSVNIRGFNVALYASAGVNIPLGYYSSVTVGPEIVIGLSDIAAGRKTYTDIFGKEYTHEPTKIKNFGLKVTLAYKL